MLNIEVNSFSFLKAGIPEDKSGHGGGFVFDCRFLPNPGRYQEYKKLTGKDQAVIDYLEGKVEVRDFQDLVRQIAEKAVKNYLSRDFKHLTFNFGCTGGQHRSVYFAESFASWLRCNFDVHVVLRHRQREIEDGEG